MKKIRKSPVRSKLAKQDKFIDKMKAMQFILDSLNGDDRKSLVTELDPENLKEKLQQFPFLKRDFYSKRYGAKDLNYSGYIAVHSLLNENN
ncbi:hypothetical protein MJH12_01840 [bacterium]|nr:hypothetical protein [bacterium]